MWLTTPVPCLWHTSDFLRHQHELVCINIYTEACIKINIKTNNYSAQNFPFVEIRFHESQDGLRLAVVVEIDRKLFISWTFCPLFVCRLLLIDWLIEGLCVCYVRACTYGGQKVGVSWFSASMDFVLLKQDFSVLEFSGSVKLPGKWTQGVVGLLANDRHWAQLLGGIEHREFDYTYPMPLL